MVIFMTDPGAALAYSGDSVQHGKGGELNVSMTKKSKSGDWREIAQAILQEGDPEMLSRLVEDLCLALDFSRPGRRTTLQDKGQGD